MRSARAALSGGMRAGPQVEATELLPLFFRLFRCPDKALRRLLFRHIIAGARAGSQAAFCAHCP